MHQFVRSLITEWRRLGLPVSNETLVIGVSGGADSLSLLLAVDDLRTRKKLDCRIVAAHFNHKLRRAASDADEEFVKQIVSGRGLELAIGHGEIGKKGNLEQNARYARYEFLVQTAKNLGSGHILTAHTVNDQAETFLLNLIRGSGVDGLSGMKPVREWRSEGVEESASGPLLPFSSLPHSPTLLIRPLLRWAKREDTENFCRESGVDFRYDTMNEDMSFKRVRVRKMLLPMLAEFNPKIVETLARTAELLSNSPSSEGGVAAPAAFQGADGVVLSETLGVAELKALEQQVLYQTLRTWLKTRRGSLRSITLKHIEAIETLIQSQKSGRTVELPGFGLVRKRDGRLSFENIKVDK